MIECFCDGSSATHAENFSYFENGGLTEQCRKIQGKETMWNISIIKKNYKKTC